MDKKIIDKKYVHVLKVRNKFKIKTMKNYYDLYLTCDVVEKFRNNSLKNYRLSKSLFERTTFNLGCNA